MELHEDDDEPVDGNVYENFLFALLVEVKQMLRMLMEHYVKYLRTHTHTHFCHLLWMVIVTLYYWCPEGLLAGYLVSQCRSPSVWSHILPLFFRIFVLVGTSGTGFGGVQVLQRHTATSKKSTETPFRGTRT